MELKRPLVSESEEEEISDQEDLSRSKKARIGAATSKHLALSNSASIAKDGSLYRG
jgi:hypothetical protein